MTASPPDDIKRRSIRAIKWSALGEWLIRTVQPLILLQLALLLSPEDFGVVGVATIAIGIGQIFQEFGVGKALVQTEGDIEEQASNAFWLNATTAGFIYLLIFLFADSIAAFFQSPDSAPVLRVLGLQIILSAFMSVQAAVLQRAVRFKALFLVRALPALLNGAVSIGLAWRGLGAWALVWGTLAGSVLQVGLYWWVSAWRPRLMFHGGAFVRMFKFSRWVMLEGLLAWLIQWGDSVALGHFLGPEVLGYYRMGTVVIAYLSNIVFTPVAPVALSLLSRLQADLPAFEDCYGKLVRILALMALPLGAGIFLLAQPATVAVLGEKWAGAGVVVQLMGVRMTIGWLIGLHSTALTAIGRPDLNVKILACAALIAVPTYIFAAPHGLLVFCWARLLAAQVDNSLCHFITRAVFRWPRFFLWSRLRLPLAAAGLMLVLLLLARQWMAVEGWLPVALMALCGAAIYLLSVRLLDAGTFAWGLKAIRQVAARNPNAFLST